MDEGGTPLTKTKPLIPVEQNFIFNEIEDNNLPHIDFQEYISCYLYSDHLKHILISKYDTNLTTDKFIHCIIDSFKTNYQNIFGDIKGLQVEGIYLKKSQGVYEKTEFQTDQDIIHISQHLYINITSTEVWTSCKITFVTSMFTVNIENEVKLDRLVKFVALKKILLKSLITQWNHVLDKDERNDVSEYLNYHYLINSYDIQVTSSDKDHSFDWNSELLNKFNIAFTVNISMIILEENLFKILQAQISKLSIVKVNLLWRSFVNLSTFEEFIMSSQLENEYNTMKANAKSLLFNLGKEIIYLYFSTYKLEDYPNDYSSTFLGGEHPKEKLIMVISPKMSKKKKIKKKLQPVESYINYNDENVSKNNSKNSSKNIQISMSDIKKTQRVENIKTFQESLDEPFLEDRNKGFNSSYQNEIENKTKSHQQQKKSFEEVNNAAKKIYKVYEQEKIDEISDESFGSNKSKKYDNKKSKCNWIIRVLSESRRPSTSLSLSKQIQRMINEKTLNKIFLSNDYVRMQKNGFDKIIAPSVRSINFKIELKDKEKNLINSKEQENSLIKFNIEIGIISLCLILLMVVIYIFVINIKK